ncbi:MAG: NC domain protein [Lysobacterales bacterium]|nr:MAG: NC domain protein [Xanthomonadales bacterium]
MLKSRHAEVAFAADFDGTIDSSPKARNQRWLTVHYTALGFAHPGIYVGCGRVVHYGAFVHGVHRGPVEEVSLARFTHGHTLWVRPGAVRFDCEEVIRRARSRIGENSYRLLSNNCEHFCEWCLRGEPRSEQVERALELPRRFARGASAAAVALLAVSAASRVWS